MPATLDSIVEEALELLPDERVTLARRLLVSVDPEAQPGADVAWETEIIQRIRRYDAGETQSVPASEVFARLAAIAPVR